MKVREPLRGFASVKSLRDTVLPLRVARRTTAPPASPFRPPIRTVARALPSRTDSRVTASVAAGLSRLRSSRVRTLPPRSRTDNRTRSPFGSAVSVSPGATRSGSDLNTAVPPPATGV